MAGKRYVRPMILLTGGMSGQDSGEVTGKGSGQSGQQVFACSFADFQTMFGKDYNGDGAIEAYDYCSFWLENGFTWETWLEYNQASDWVLDEHPTGYNP